MSAFVRPRGHARSGWWDRMIVATRGRWLPRLFRAEDQIADHRRCGEAAENEQKRSNQEAVHDAYPQYICLTARAA